MVLEMKKKRGNPSKELQDFTKLVVIDVEETGVLPIDHWKIKGVELLSPTVEKCVPISVENPALAYDDVNDRFKIDIEKSITLSTDPTDRPTRALGLIYGSAGQLMQQDPTTYDMLVQLRHEGVKIDPRNIRTLTSSDQVTIASMPRVEQRSHYLFTTDTLVNFAASLPLPAQSETARLEQTTVDTWVWALGCYAVDDTLAHQDLRMRIYNAAETLVWQSLTISELVTAGVDVKDPMPTVGYGITLIDTAGFKTTFIKNFRAPIYCEGGLKLSVWNGHATEDVNYGLYILVCYSRV